MTSGYLRILASACLLAAFTVGIAHAEVMPSQQPGSAALREATFAAGCFWCSEKDFEKLPGVADVISGYTGGRTPNPTYEEVGAGTSGHVEAIRVRFDPARISYAALLDHYWRNVDFTDAGGQFCDRGESYRPVIFVHDDEQKTAAEKSRAELMQKKQLRSIAVEIRAASKFTPAEDYHQDYYKKNPVRYAFYRNGCGRDARLRQLWPESTSQ